MSDISSKGTELIDDGSLTPQNTESFLITEFPIDMGLAEEAPVGMEDNLEHNFRMEDVVLDNNTSDLIMIEESTSFNYTEVEDTVQTEDIGHKLQAAATEQTPFIEMKTFGLNWKLESVANCHDDSQILLKALIPYDDQGNPVFLIFKPVEEQLSAPETVEISGDIEVIDSAASSQSDNNENDVQIINVSTVANVAEDEVAATSQSTNNDQRSNKFNLLMKDNPKHFTFKEIENRRSFKPAVSKDGTFVTDENNPHNSRAARTFSPIQFEQDKSIPIVPILETKKGSPKKFTCQFCREGFPQHHKWKRHVEAHVGKVVNQCTCPECGVPYRDYRTMRRRHNEAYA